MTEIRRDLASLATSRQETGKQDVVQSAETRDIHESCFSRLSHASSFSKVEREMFSGSAVIFIQESCT